MSNGEVLYLQTRRKNLMDEFKALLDETIDSVSESDKIATMIRNMMVNVLSGDVTEQDLEDYGSLIPVLVYKAKVMKEEQHKRESRINEITKEVVYIDRLCEGEDEE